jgi:hypothetical protein
MATIRRIAVLLHERHRDALSEWYRVWCMVPHWRAKGIEVVPVWGIERAIDADLLIPHIDLSYIPDDYWHFIQRHPHVVNRAVRDIRKRVISANLLRPGDQWDGPVIVKTDNNCRGRMEQKLLGEPPPESRLEAWFRRAARRPWAERWLLGHVRHPSRYYIFRSMRAVPREVWSNPALVVERFLPERWGRDYVIRMYSFFGDRHTGRCMRGPDPWVKTANAELADHVEPPEAVIALRHRLGLEFGRIDYVLRDGQPVVLDVNRTPGMSGPPDGDRVERSREMAEGLSYFERRAEPSSRIVPVGAARSTDRLPEPATRRDQHAPGTPRP